MCSPGIDGEGELRGQLANPGSPGKMAVKTDCVCVCVVARINGQDWNCTFTASRTNIQDMQLFFYSIHKWCNSSTTNITNTNYEQQQPTRSPRTPYWGSCFLNVPQQFAMVMRRVRVGGAFKKQDPVLILAKPSPKIVSNLKPVSDSGHWVGIMGKILNWFWLRVPIECTHSFWYRGAWVRAISVVCWQRLNLQYISRPSSVDRHSSLCKVFRSVHRASWMHCVTYGQLCIIIT